MRTQPSKVINRDDQTERDLAMIRNTEELFSFNGKSYWVFRELAYGPNTWAVMEDGTTDLVAFGLASKDAAAAVCMELCLAKPTMSRELAIKELRECRSSDDPEEAHAAADGVLCALLAALGYEDVVLEYTMVTKWYA